MILLQGLPHASSLVAGLVAGILAAPSLLRRHSGRIVSAPAAAVSPLRRDCGGAATLGGLGPGPLPVPARRPGPQAPGSRSVAHSPASSAANRSAQDRRPVRWIAAIPRGPLPGSPGPGPGRPAGAAAPAAAVAHRAFPATAPSQWRPTLVASGAGGRPAGAAAPAYLVRDLRDLPSGWPGRHCIAHFAAPFRPTPASRQLSAVLPIIPIHKESDLTRPGQLAQIYVHEMDVISPSTRAD
jgi:hypothetical protein